jgi:hypothetical protein
MPPTRTRSPNKPRAKKKATPASTELVVRESSAVAKTDEPAPPPAGLKLSPGGQPRATFGSAGSPTPFPYQGQAAPWADQNVQATKDYADAAVLAEQARANGAYAASQSLGTVLFPSGDATGATDTASINAALLSGQKVICRGTTGGMPFWLNGPVVLNSNNTLILWDAHLKLIAGLSSNILTNHNSQVTPSQNYGLGADTGIRVKGFGSAWLDGNASAQVRPSDPNLWSAIGVCWVNATDVRVDDVKIGPTQVFAGCQFGCSNMRWSNIELAQDRSTHNQDGIDTGPGCSDIVISDVTGITGDDGFSVFAKLGASGASSGNTTPWTIAAHNANPANLTTHDVRVDNATVAIYYNFARCQAGDGAQLYDVHFTNLTKIGPLANVTSEQCILEMGALSYVTTPPATSDLYNITVDGFKGSCTYALGADSNFSHVKMSNLHIEGPFRALLAQEHSTATTAHDIHFDNVSSDDAIGAADYMMGSQVGSAWDRVNFSQINLKASNGLLLNRGTITNLDVQGVHVGIGTGPLIASTIAETGAIDKVRVDTPSSIRYSTGTKLRFGPQMPKFLGVDSLSTPTFGSHAQYSNLKDPTGGTHFVAGYFIGDGTAWNRIIDLPNYAEASPSFVKAGGNAVASAASQIVVTVPAGGHAAGNIVMVAVATSSVLVSSVTDTRGNSWTTGHASNGSTALAEGCWSKLVTALQAGDQITITLASSATSIVADSAEWTHLITFDTTVSNNSTSSTSSPNSGTTNTLRLPNELLITTFAFPASAGTFTPQGGFSVVNTPITNTIELAWMAESVSATTALTPAATTTSAHSFAAVTFAFVAGGDPAGG